MPQELIDATFEKEILAHPGVALVDFWAPWCGPCRAVGPIIEEISREYAGKVKVGKLNVDDNPETAQKFSVMSIPTVLIFKNGELEETLIGAQPKEAYIEKIESLT